MASRGCSRSAHWLLREELWEDSELSEDRLLELLEAELASPLEILLELLPELRELWLDIELERELLELLSDDDSDELRELRELYELLLEMLLEDRLLDEELSEDALLDQLELSLELLESLELELTLLELCELLLVELSLELLE